jgi:predicted dehydrogenase
MTPEAANDMERAKGRRAMSGGRTDPVGVLMVAIGGYGYYYLETLLDQVSPSRARLVGVVDPEARQSSAWPRVEQLGVPVCDTVEAFYAAGHTADLVVVVSPIQHHVPQCCVALEHGSDVLCDKPLGATIQDARELIAARDRSRRWVLVGYQWSFSAAIQSLKRDLLAGLFGRPLRCSTICCWPRDFAYYRRNNWTGRLRDAVSGRWILDSPANNAMAHFLHNALYLCGDAAAHSAVPSHVQAEMYRAYPIESCDTVAARVQTTNRIEVLFYASHVTESPIAPTFRLECEDATVTFGGAAPSIVATDTKGRSKDYGSPEATSQFQKLFDAIDAAGGPAPALCGPEAAGCQTLAINGMHESVPDVRTFPPGMTVRDDTAGRLQMTRLGEMLLQCYEQAALPSEARIAWAEAGPRIDLAGYQHFPKKGVL